MVQRAQPLPAFPPAMTQRFGQSGAVPIRFLRCGEVRQRHRRRSDWQDDVRLARTTVHSTARQVRSTIRDVNRRRLLATGSGAVGRVSLGGIARPYLSRAADRPLITHGIQSGDVSADAGDGLGARRPAGAHAVEVATTDSFKTIHGGVFVDALPESDFTAKALLEDLPAGQDIFYRIRFAGSAAPTILGEPHVGRFRTAPADRRVGLVRLVGRHRGAGLGHRRGARRHAHLRDHAAEPARFLHPQRRHDLCRLRRSRPR